jgi:polysaccharide export outer membrane protein
MKKRRSDISLRCGLVIALALIVQPSARAQQSVAPLTSSSPSTAAATDGGAASSTSRASTDQYRIGPRDILSVRVSAGRAVPELSMESVEVDECGRIPLPSVQYEERNEIQAAGRTRTELAEELRTFFLKYKRNPQVIVTIKEYNSQPVAINGAVVKPGQFQMRRPVQLLELVQFYAGGPTERAGGRIQLARLNNFQTCRGAETAPAASIEFLVFNLKDTLTGAEAANPYLQPGDVVTLPEAKEAYVVGNVLRPGPVILKEDNLTVSKAIAMAGGTMPDTKKDRVRIIRQEPGSNLRKEILVDLQAIDKQKAPDVALLPNDIVDVPTASGKRLLRSLVGAVVPAVGQLPVRVIP